jgi:hypothetical protein
MFDFDDGHDRDLLYQRQLGIPCTAGDAERIVRIALSAWHNNTDSRSGRPLTSKSIISVI